MSPKENRAVIWDMDGVLVDTAEHHYQSWKFAFAKQGIEFSQEDFKKIFGMRNDAIIRKTMGGGAGRDKIEEVAKDKEEFFRTTVKRDLRPFPGVIDLLKTLKGNGIRSAIASSAPMENIRVILEGLGIKEYFQALVYGQEVTEGKPSPLIFQLAARKLGVETRCCIVIEDAVAGVKAAKAAGMRCIAVTNSHPAESLAGADLVVDSLQKVGLNELNKLFEIC
jgi:beta-phosphoglucomutase family hydrolase